MNMWSKRVSVGLMISFFCLMSSCKTYQDLGEKPIASVQTEAFKNQVQTVGKAKWVSGNQIKTLVNGDEYYPRMLQAIQGAKHSITFETFAYVKSHLAREFTIALEERARAGVKVHMILDAIGSRRIMKEDIAFLKKAGVQFHFYNPWRVWSILGINNRTHRKILVVDGRIAYTGGSGFADAWKGDARNPNEWRDTQYEIRGPLVAEWQHGFNNNWEELTGNKLQGESYFPSLKKKGSILAQASLGAPYERGDTLGSTCLLAIEAAQKEIYIAQAYFIVHKAIREALIRARQRGVRVVTLTPNEHIDVPYVRRASHAFWKPLLEAGVEMYEYQPSMMHGKLMIVDGFFSIVGSANLDPRSYFSNDEMNINVLDKSFARRQLQMLQYDLQQSKRMNWKQVKPAFYEYPYYWTLKLISPLL